jgi:hypothetical protein
VIYLSASFAPEGCVAMSITPWAPAAPRVEPPPRQTPEAAKCEAVVTAFEALQAAGYYLHAEDGAVLDKAQFIDAMVLAMNAALAPLPAAGEEPRDE